METHPFTAKNWSIVALIALVLGLWFVAPFLGVIAIAALMAFLFHGTYNWLQLKMKDGAAATLTFFWTLLVVLVPVILIGLFTIFQLGRLVTDVTNTFGTDFTSLPAALQVTITNINAFAAQLGADGQVITTDNVIDFVKTVLPAVVGSITAFLTGFVGGIPLAIILFIMYVFLFFEFLLFGKKVTGSVVALSPFQPDVTRMYLARIGLMANAMAKGELVISLMIALLEALTLCIFFGFWDYYLLLTVVFTLFNLVPLGAGIIMYPIVFIEMLIGPFWPAFGALIAITAVSNLESFIRPKFIPKSITLTNGLTMLAAFGGIALFGVIGVVYGPIIMIVIVTSIQMYLDYYQELPRWKQRANRSAK